MNKMMRVIVKVIMVIKFISVLMRLVRMRVIVGMIMKEEQL